jgi:signal transduction histidine kinase
MNTDDPLVIFGRDITARVRAEAERKAAHKLLQATIDGLCDPILLIGDDYQVQLMNRAARNNHDVGTKPLCYQILHRRDTPCDGAAHPCPLARVRESLRPVTVVHEHVRDGEKRIVEIIASPLLGEDGLLTGIVEATRDVTARVRAEQERDSLIAELKAKNVELEHFTYSVSHDLKSPLITIQGFMSLLLKNVADGNTERVEGNAAYILAAVERMKQLLNELLKLSRIGRVVNPPEEVSMGDLVREVLDTLTGQLEERGIRVIISPDLLRPAGATVCVDRVRLHEVWENLLSNAIKYMGEQTDPLLEIGLRQDGAETVFYVRDNGLGIDPRFHARIFDLFEKLDPTTEGVGAGLAIVKRIVEMHRGRVWAESEGEGHGSVFCFTLAGS